MAAAKQNKSLSHQSRLKGSDPVNGRVSALKELKREHARKGWLKKVWGKWPGDESIEDLLALLTK